MTGRSDGLALHEVTVRYGGNLALEGSACAPPGASPA